MSIKATIITALTPVLSNVWAVELPVKPTFPAIVFEIETNPENIWATPSGAAYDQHTVSVVILAKTLTQVETLLAQTIAALELIPGYLLDGERGDASYEEDASVYGYYTNHVIRKQRY